MTGEDLLLNRHRRWKSTAVLAALAFALASSELGRLLSIGEENGCGHFGEQITSGVQP